MKFQKFWSQSSAQRWFTTTIPKTQNGLGLTESPFILHLQVIGSPARRTERDCERMREISDHGRLERCSLGSLSRALSRNASVATPAECRRGCMSFLEISESVAGIAVTHQDSSIAVIR